MKTLIPLSLLLAVTACGGPFVELEDNEPAPNPSPIVIAPDELDAEPLVYPAEVHEPEGEVFYLPGAFGWEPYAFERDAGWLIAEGDIILGTEEDLARQQAAASLFTNLGTVGELPWPNNTIPYVLDSSITGTGIDDTVLQAIDQWNEETVVKVRPRVGAETPFLRIQAQDPSAAASCAAQLGTGIGGGERKMFLRPNCGVGTIKHELGHVVGIAHEHVRVDRDDHIRIRTEFIRPGLENHFTIKKGVSFGSYDIRSRMHYFNYTGSTERLVSARNGEHLSGEMTVHRVNCQPNDDRATCLVGGNQLTPRDTAGLVRVSDGPSPGSYRLRNEWSGNCLRTTVDHLTPNTAIDPSTCGNTSSRRWYKSEAANDNSIFVHRYSRMCINSLGSNAVLGACDGSASAELKLVAVSGGFQLRQGDRCLREWEGDIYFSSCNNTPTRRWELVP